MQVSNDIPAVYVPFGTNARNKGRDVSSLLDEKYNVYGGRVAQRNKVVVTESLSRVQRDFEAAYNTLRSPTSQPSSKVFEDLSPYLPNIERMNMTVLAMAEFIRRRIGVATFDEFMTNSDGFLSEYNNAWSQLTRLTSLMKIGAKRSEHSGFELDTSRRAHSKPQQVVRKDVLRYIHQIYEGMSYHEEGEDEEEEI